MSKHKPNRRRINEQRTMARKERASQQHLSLRMYVQDSRALAPRLQRLAQDIAASPDMPKAMRLSCDECEALLEFYVDAERRGKRAHTIFPAVWKHLKTCARCQASYELLAGAWDEEGIPNFDAVPASTSPLAFLVPAASDAPWTKHVGSRVGGGPINFGLSIKLLHLRRRLSTSQPAMFMRGESGSANRALALSDTLSLGDLDVMVRIWVQRLEISEFVRLEIMLASSAPLPDLLRVNLIWNDHTHSDVIHEGRFSFDKFPASALDGGRNLRVEFEADDNPAVAEGDSGGDIG